MKKALFVAIFGAFCLFLAVNAEAGGRRNLRPDQRRECIPDYNRDQLNWVCPEGLYIGHLGSNPFWRGGRDHRQYDPRYDRRHDRRGGIGVGEAIAAGAAGGAVVAVVSEIFDAIRSNNAQTAQASQPQQFYTPPQSETRVIIVEREASASSASAQSRYEHKTYRGYYETAPVRCTEEQMRRGKAQYGTDGWLQVVGDPNSRCYYDLR